MADLISGEGSEMEGPKLCSMVTDSIGKNCLRSLLIRNKLIIFLETRKGQMLIETYSEEMLNLLGSRIHEKRWK